MKREIVKKIINWIKEEVKKANCKGVVFGLSGGVDSSVVSVLCKKSFPKNHLALIMPCFSDKKDIRDALLIVKKFKIKYEVIKLDSVFLEFCKILNVDKNSKDIEVVNIKPRLRMTTLYHYANKLNYLVVGTGNKSELTVGYFTKYGDGGVDILPIGDFTKTEVYQLAKFLRIPEKIINKPPSAGLWDGQTDETEMGITYKELDEIIKAIETGKIYSLSSMNYTKVVNMMKKNLHKISPPRIFKYEK
mgnify:CR=1 FL=1